MEKHIYRFSSGEKFEANKDDLQERLKQYKEYLDNYLDLSSCMYDDEYVARGNGFCDTKFSDSFISDQISNYQKKIEELQSWIDSFCE